jgi:L-ascorbate metabolism protein UlaG (beta-lactamase superfamily)
MSMRHIAGVAGALVLTAAITAAQNLDRIAATGGDVTITPLNHATLALTHGSTVVLIDPTPQAKYDGLPAPTLILVTDIHGDHLSPPTVEKVKGANTAIVAPEAAASQLPGATVLANGEKKTVAGVPLEGVAMYNLVRGPSAGQLFHTKGRGNGYVLTLGGKRVYVAGDTECTPEMKALTNIDVAFVPMNLPYTMTPVEAAGCVAAFKPKVVYPYHYRGQNLDEFKNALANSGIEVRIRDWYK